MTLADSSIATQATDNPIAAKHGAGWLKWIDEALSAGCKPSALVSTMAAAVWQREDAILALQERATCLGISIKLHCSRPTIPKDDTFALSDGQIITVLSRIAHPNAVVMANVFTPAECQALIKCAAQKGLHHSSVVDAGSGNSVMHEARTSSGVFLTHNDLPLVAQLEQRLAELSNWPAERAEGIQILRYAPGQQYKPHFDWFNPEKPGSAVHLQRGGQRVGTIVIYLATAESGGGTSFPKAGIEVRPPLGGAVFFNDVDELGMPDDMSLHGGTPVSRGTKIVATYWQREHEHPRATNKPPSTSTVSASAEPLHTTAAISDPNPQRQIDAEVRQLMKKDRAAALALARDWSQRHPDHIYSRLMYAWTLGANGHFEDEIRELQQCANVAPDQHISRCLALACHRIGDYAASFHHRLQVLTYPQHEAHDVLRAAFAANLNGQRDWARSLHHTAGKSLQTAEGLFGQFLIEQQHSRLKTKIREQLLALGERSDQAVWFWKEHDAHPYRVMDNKRGLNALIRTACQRTPDWWPETYDLSDSQQQADLALAADPQAWWIYKRANLVATQGCHVGRGSLQSWLSPQDLAADAIIQRYLDKPCLAAGRKFNLRLQLCLQAPYPEAAFLWHDGLAFLATSDYQPDSFTHDRAAHFVNPLSAHRELLSTPIGPYPAPGMALRQFLALSFDSDTGARIMADLTQLAREVVAILEAGGLLAAIREIPHWRAMPPKFFGMDVGLDAQLKPWLFELERFSGMGTGNPGSKAVLARFRQDWLPFALGMPSERFLPLS